MRIPSVHELKERLSILYPRYPFSLFTEPARKVCEYLRELRSKGVSFEITEEKLDKLLVHFFEEYMSPNLKRVINGTGVIAHTNLGRAPLSESILSYLTEIAIYYSNLEYDLKEGKRGSRYSHVEELLLELTGAEAGLVVNNNASAVLISLNTLAKGKEVIVSRGELVEIGGSFRIPEVMEWAGCYLREVGTTNKTHLHDYERAINENTALLLKVHKSNYAIVGFVKEISIEELVSLGRRYNLPVMEDLGSGSLIDFSKYGLQKEPTVQESIRKGVDIVTFSGDKLLGGPQAGIILGKKIYIEKIRKNPLNRAVRIDKLTLAGLEATLRLYRDENQAIEHIPVLRMILEKPETTKKRARKLLAKISKISDNLEAHLVKTIAKTGGGALPLLDLPSYGVAIRFKNLSAKELQKLLRNQSPPVIGIIEEDKFVIDAKCLFDRDLDEITEIFKRLSNEFSSSS